MSPHSTMREVTTMRSPHTTTKSSSHSLKLEKSPRSSEDPAQPKINKTIFVNQKVKWITIKNRVSIYHMQLCSMLCGSLDGRGVWGKMDTCICMAQSLLCSVETIITLLISDTPIQNKFYIYIWLHQVLIASCGI